MALLLDPTERAQEAQRCLELLEPELSRMQRFEVEFIENRKRYVDVHGVSQSQLSYLNELVQQYVLKK